MALMTVADVVAALKLSRPTVARMIADGRLPVCRFGRAVRIRPADLEELIERLATVPPDDAAGPRCGVGPAVPAR